jgi:hypothetical protein
MWADARGPGHSHPSARPRRTFSPNPASGEWHVAKGGFRAGVQFRQPPMAMQYGEPIYCSSATAPPGHASLPMTYTCPMHPEIRRTAPGKCPKCGADLVPVGTTPHGTFSGTPRSNSVAASVSEWTIVSSRTHAAPVPLRALRSERHERLPVEGSPCFSPTRFA